MRATTYIFLHIDEHITESGPIEPDIPYDQIRKEPLPLPKEFEWCEVDMADEKQVKFNSEAWQRINISLFIKLRELYELLSLNYVEDDEAQFRFDYSAEFLKWY